MASAKEPSISGHTHAGRKVESEANSTSNAALSRSVGSNDHVQVGTGTKFDKVIGDKVLELNAHNGSCHISLAVIRYRLDGSNAAYPSASRTNVPGREDPSVSSFT